LQSRIILMQLRLGKNFDATPAPEAVAPALVTSVPTFFNSTKVNIRIGTVYFHEFQ
jgi:hypothetical protein